MLFRSKDKHPELLADFRTLQRELEELEKSLQKLKVTTMYLPLPANELNQVSLLSCVHISGNKTPLNTWIVLSWIET